jgi:hypothetical protein
MVDGGQLHTLVALFLVMELLVSTGQEDGCIPELDQTLRSLIPSGNEPQLSGGVREGGQTNT